MSDTMLYGVLRMPYEMAMGDEISRRQFYARAQEAADRLEAAERATPPSPSTEPAQSFHCGPPIATYAPPMLAQDWNDPSPSAALREALNLIAGKFENTVMPPEVEDLARQLSAYAKEAPSTSSEVGELLAALRPFADAFERVKDTHTDPDADIQAFLDGNKITPAMSTGDFRRAYETVNAALAAKPATIDVGVGEERDAARWRRWAPYLQRTLKKLPFDLAKDLAATQSAEPK